MLRACEAHLAAGANSVGHARARADGVGSIEDIRPVLTCFSHDERNRLCREPFASCGPVGLPSDGWNFWSVGSELLELGQPVLRRNNLFEDRESKNFGRHMA